MINDTELLNRISRDDSDAFKILSDRYMPLVQSLIRKYSHDGMTREDIEDIGQEAQVFLFKAARTYDADSGLTFGLYAQICIRNGLVSLARKKKNEIKRVNTDVRDMELTAPDTTKYVDEAESADALMRKIKSILSPKELVVFRYLILDYKNARIAKELGISPKSVENAVFRIKKKLGAMLL